MGRFCTNCGKELYTGASFCAKCGAAVLKTSIKPDTVRQAKPAPKPQVKKEPHALKASLSHKEARGKSSVALKKNAGRNALCIILSLLLVIQLAAVALYGWPGLLLTNKDGFVETEKAIVSLDKESITLSGVRIDVNSLNLIDGEKELIVRRKEEKLDQDSGLTSVEYDISLGEMHYLYAPLTITLPYDKATAQGGDIAIEHYNSDYELWIPQVTVNNGDGTVSASLTSLSPVKLVYLGKDYPSSVFYISEKDSNYAKMTVNHRYWDIIKNQARDDAKVVVKDFVENGNTKNTMPWTENLLTPEGIDKTNNIYSIFDELVNTISSFTKLTSMKMSHTVEKVSNGVSVVGLGIALTQLGIDLTNSQGDDRNAAVNLYKNIFSSSGSLFSYMTGYWSLPFSAAFLGVAVLAYGLDYGVEMAEDYKESVNRAIFDQYFKDYARFNEQYWYKLFVESYWHEWQNGTASAEGIEEAYKTVLDGIDKYTEQFWADVFREGSDALTFAVGEADKTNYYKPTAEQKSDYTEGLRRYMYARFREKVIPWIEQFIIKQQQDALYASLNKLCEPFNEYYSVQIQEIAPVDSADPCKYQEHTIRFANESGFALVDIVDTWTLHAPQDDDQWAVRSEFTFLSYLLAGAPDRIMLFPKGSDAKKTEDATLTQSFSVEEEFTLIWLEQEEKDHDYYLVERYDFDNRYLYYDGYGYKIMALKQDPQTNGITEHLTRGLDAEVKEDSYHEFSYDPSSGFLKSRREDYYQELKPNQDWTAFRGYDSTPEYLAGKWGLEEGRTGKNKYVYTRYLKVKQVSPGKWQVDETGEIIEYVENAFDFSDNQEKRLESPSGQSFLAEARSFATEIGVEMYDGQGYD